MLRRLIKASAIVIGVGLAVAACSPVKIGSAAIVGSQRITIATLGTEVTNLNQAAKQYPGVVNLTPTEATQATLTWLIRYQINDELARQAGITVSTAQAEVALAQAYATAKTAAEQQGMTNVTPTLILASSGMRSELSSTTRIGDAPATIRTVSCGSSISTVPIPTSTASQAARRPCDTTRSASQLIQRESPVAVAIRPSSVCAYLRITRGPLLPEPVPSSAPTSSCAGAYSASGRPAGST